MTKPNGHGSLSGIRVIDLTRVLGGPYCTQVLGDHGADVIKIEPPQGDEVRDWGPPFRDGTASYFIGVNRNKRTHGARPVQAGGARGAAAPARGRRRADPQFQAGHAGEMGHRLRRGAGAALPAADLLPHHRLRRRRAARRPAGLRRGGAGRLRPDEHQRHAGVRADPHGHADRRPRHRPQRRDRHPDGAATSATAPARARRSMSASTTAPWRCCIRTPRTT